jgi:hypothetical protein
MEFRSALAITLLALITLGQAWSSETEPARNMEILRNFNSATKEPAWAAQNDGGDEKRVKREK